MTLVKARRRTARAGILLYTRGGMNVWACAGSASTPDPLRLSFERIPASADAAGEPTRGGLVPPGLPACVDAADPYGGNPPRIPWHHICRTP